MSSKPAICVENVSKVYNIYAAPHDRLKQMILPRFRRAVGLRPNAYFKQFQALHDVSFEVGRGETIGIVGRNGSGKSTLLQIICGTLTPSGGSVVKNGRIAALLELGAGFNPEFTGRDNAALNAAILGLDPDAIEELMPKIEKFADVGDFFDRPMLTYSSGMYVRVAFAVQALMEPEILIVDEALAVGDAEFQAKCHDRIRKLRDAGTSILFVSHDVGAVRTLCDRAIWIDAGRVRMNGSIYTVTSEYIRRLFDGARQEDPGVDTAAEASNEAAIETETAEKVVIDEPDVPADPVPLNHWGSHIGIVKRVYTTDGRGKRTRSFRDNEIVNISIELEVPDDISRENLAVAFSIKTLSGLDLMVGSTWQNGRAPFVDARGKITVHFSFENIFNTNEYMIAVGVEDRTNVQPSYYEHVEGVAYIRMDMTEKHFGLIAPVINQAIETAND